MGLIAQVRATAAAVRAAARARRNIALRSALAMAIPLAAGLAIGQPEAGAGASFGALACLYAPQAPYRYRARVVAAIGAGLVLAVLLGALAAPSGLVAALVAGLVAGVASFLCQAAELPPPRELMLVMAVLAATDGAEGSTAALARAGLAAAGALVAWLVTMSPAVFGRRRAPERRAVVEALGAVAALLDAVGDAGHPAARHAAVVAVRRSRDAVVQGGLAPDHRLTRAAVAAEALLEAALHVDVESTRPLDPGWAAAVRALMPALAGATEHSDGGAALPSTAGVVGAEALARAVAAARAALGVEPPPVPQHLFPARLGVLAQLRVAWQGHSVVLPAAARIGIAVAVGVGLGRVLGLGHAYWVGLTAVAVLQGSNLAVTRTRVVHRVVGTVVGVGLGFAVLGWGPPLWLVALVAVVFQGVVELVIVTRYWLAVVAITVLALALFHLGSPTEDVGAAIGARLLDTAIGAAVALLLRLVLWPRATSSRLPRVQARAIGAVRATLAAAWRVAGGAAGAAEAGVLTDERRRLQAELANLHVVHADALADTGARSSDDRWPVSVAVEELSVLALSWPAHRTPPGAADGAAFLGHLDGLAAAVAGGVAPPSAVPVLPGLPRTSAAACALTEAVQDVGRS
jgi:uncharacterized membrane protein YccC